MSIDTLTFYSPLPVFGVALSRQWDDFRHDFRQLSTLIRAAYADISTTPGDHDLSGWALGELDFHNRFRIFYDKVNRQFKIQVNTGILSIGPAAGHSILWGSIQKIWTCWAYVQERYNRILISRLLSHTYL